MADKNEEYSLEVLEGTPPRVTKFLQAIGSLPIVRTQLAQAGMKDTDITEGRELLLACLAQPLTAKANPDTEDAKQQRAAIVELNDWDEPGYGRFGATLRRKSKSAHAYIFNGLAASRDPAEAVKGIATFLTRLDALEAGTDPDRADSAAEDRAVVQFLAERQLTTAERSRLRALVDRALGPTKPLDVLPEVDPIPARVQKLTAVREWFEEWSEIARAVVKRRADLIRLGLAHRKSSKTTGAGEGEGGEGSGDPDPGAL